MPGARCSAISTTFATRPAPGVSVAQVARRYAVNANLIFKWLRDRRYAPDPASALPPSEEARFLPVEIVAETRSAPAAAAAEVVIADEVVMVADVAESDDESSDEHAVRPSIAVVSPIAATAVRT